MWEVKSRSSVVSASRIAASGWEGGECGVSAALERAFVLEILNPEDGTDRLSRNVGKKLSLLAV